MTSAAADLGTAVEALVHEVESGTSAEIVVVVAGSSDRYTDVLGWAVGIPALLATAFFCWSPWVFDDLWIPIDTLGVAGAFGLVLGTSMQMRSRLVGRKEQARRVARSADAAFWEEAVHATRGRTGILVYVSVLEGVVEVRADMGIASCVPAGKWNKALLSLQGAHASKEAFAAGFRALGAVLAEHLPRAEDDVNESPDAPRMRR